MRLGTLSLRMPSIVVPVHTAIVEYTPEYRVSSCSDWPEMSTSGRSRAHLISTLEKCIPDSVAKSAGQTGPSAEYRRRLYPARHPSRGRHPYSLVKSAGQTPSASAEYPRGLRVGQTPGHLQNIAGACSPQGNRVEATLRGLDSNTPRLPTFVLLVSPPRLSVPRAIDYFTIEAQSRRNRSLCTSHSNHRPGLSCF